MLEDLACPALPVHASEPDREILVKGDAQVLARLTGRIAFESKEAIRPLPSLDGEPPSQSGEPEASPRDVPDARCERADLGGDVLSVAQPPGVSEPLGEPEPCVDHHSRHDESVRLGPDLADPLATLLEPIDPDERLAKRQGRPQRGLTRKRPRRGRPFLGGLERCEQVAILHGRLACDAQKVDVDLEVAGAHRIEPSRLVQHAPSAESGVASDGPPFRGASFQPQPDGRLVRVRLESEQRIALVQLASARQQAQGLVRTVQLGGGFGSGQQGGRAVAGRGPQLRDPGPSRERRVVAPQLHRQGGDRRLSRDARSILVRLIDDAFELVQTLLTEESSSPGASDAFHEVQHGKAARSTVLEGLLQLTEVVAGPRLEPSREIAMDPLLLVRGQLRECRIPDQVVRESHQLPGLGDQAPGRQLGGRSIDPFGRPPLQLREVNWSKRPIRDGQDGQQRCCVSTRPPKASSDDGADIGCDPSPLDGGFQPEREPIRLGPELPRIELAHPRREVSDQRDPVVAFEPLQIQLNPLRGGKHPLEGRREGGRIRRRTRCGPEDEGRPRVVGGRDEVVDERDRERIEPLQVVHQEQSRLPISQGPMHDLEDSDGLDDGGFGA